MIRHTSHGLCSVERSCGDRGILWPPGDDYLRDSVSSCKTHVSNCWRACTVNTHQLKPFTEVVGYRDKDDLPAEVGPKGSWGAVCGREGRDGAIGLWMKIQSRTLHVILEPLQIINDTWWSFDQPLTQNCSLISHTWHIHFHYCLKIKASLAEYAGALKVCTQF